MKKERIILGVLALLVLLFVLELALRPKQVKSSLAEALYRFGKHKKAAELYEKIGEDSLALANKGKAEYRQEEAAKALESYDKARTLSQQKHGIDYDAGNAEFSQKDYQKAVENYILALLENPADEDSKANLELALRKLKEQPPKPQQQPEEDDEKDEDNNRKEEDLRLILEALDNKEVQDRKPAKPQTPSRSEKWW